MREVWQEIWEGIPLKGKVILLIVLLKLMFVIILLSMMSDKDCGVITEKGFQKVPCEDIQVTPYTIIHD